MSEPWDVYRYTQAVADEERATEYRKGGFLCVQLNQYLDGGRYHVLHKLGRGSFATVWLAYDKRHSQWVSIKILRADQLSSSQELQHYTNIGKALKMNHLSTIPIVHLIDQFRHKCNQSGDVHQCLVFELLGPSLFSETSQNVGAGVYPGCDDTEEIFLMAIRLLQGMVAFHKIGYAWGDPSPKNLAFTFPSKGLSQQQVLHLVGEPEETPLERLDGKPLGKGVPRCLVSSATFPEWPMEDYEADIRILDLGSSFPVITRMKDHAQPRFMQPPESIFDHEVGYETDLWGAGILLHYFIFGSAPPFGVGDDAVRVQNMVDYIGPVPSQWRSKWGVMQTHLEPTRKIVPPGSILRGKFATAKHSAEVKALLPVMQGLLRFRPESRDSAQHALDSVVQICRNSRDEDLKKLVPT